MSRNENNNTEARHVPNLAAHGDITVQSLRSVNNAVPQVSGDQHRTAIDGSAKPPAPRSLRFQLLFWVNLVLSVLVVGALVMDYRGELDHRTVQKRAALEAESSTIAAALRGLEHHGREAIQDFLDTVCSGVSEATSPGHHIVAVWEDVVMQPGVHKRDSAEMVTAMIGAGHSREGRTSVSGAEIVVAAHESASGTVYVASELTNIRRFVLRESLWRLATILAGGAVATLVVNIILVRGLAQPLERLVVTVGKLAEGNLGVRCGGFRTAELDALALAINDMSATLKEHAQERNRQLDKARQLQGHLLQDWLAVPGIALERVFQPATEVTGDYTDLAQAADGAWLLCIADVSGHGIPAAMEAAMLKTLFLAAAESAMRPHEVLSLLNQRLAQVLLPGDFASMFVLRWDDRVWELEYASAGHDPGWLLTAAGELHRLDATGTLLGIQPESSWTSRSVSVSEGDRVLLVTDGVTDCADAAGELFGRERLLHVFRSSKNLDARSAIHSIFDALEQHRQTSPAQDDVTIILAEFQGRDGRMATREMSISETVPR